MHALEIKNLTKTYADGVQALKGIDLTVEQGDFFGLLGANGAGKSTTIGIVTALVTKTAGQVSVFGHDIDSEPNLAKACIGLVPQEFNFNIFEKVSQILYTQAGYYGLSRRQAQAPVERYLHLCQLWEKRDTIASRLSGGMKRRLMIARALLHSPKLLILDEPTAGVDIEIRRDIWQFLTALNQSGTTIILTSHYLEEIENLCQNLAIIAKGEIITRSSISGLLQTLNVETLILNLLHPIINLPTIPGFTFRWRDNMTLEVDIPREQGLTNLFAELSQLSIDIASLRNKSNRLEELFLGLIKS